MAGLQGVDADDEDVQAAIAAALGGAAPMDEDGAGEGDGNE